MGGLIFMPPFLLYQDPYDCRGEVPLNSCKDYVCGLPVANRASYTITPVSIESLANAFGDFHCPVEVE